jgi:hypothetical protein
MIAIQSLSGTGSCGGNDFWRPRFKEDGLSAEKAGGHQVEKRRYALENKTISKPLKVHIYSRDLSTLWILIDSILKKLIYSNQPPEIFET